MLLWKSMYKFLCIFMLFLVYKHKSRITGSYINSVFNWEENIVFQSECTVLQLMLVKVPVSLHLPNTYYYHLSCKSSFIGTTPHSFIYTMPMTTFTVQWHNWVVEKDTVWLEKPKILTIWLYTKKFANCC